MPKPTLYTTSTVLTDSVRPSVRRQLVREPWNTPLESVMRIWDGNLWVPLEVSTDAPPAIEIPSIQLTARGFMRTHRAASLQAAATLSALASPLYAGPTVKQGGSTPFVNGTTISITLPSNLVVGNLLVVLLGNSGITMNAPSGWTSLGSSGVTSNYARVTAYTKVVEASDQGAIHEWWSYSTYHAYATWLEIQGVTGTPVVATKEAVQSDSVQPYEMRPTVVSGKGFLGVSAHIFDRQTGMESWNIVWTPQTPKPNPTAWVKRSPTGIGEVMVVATKELAYETVDGYYTVTGVVDPEQAGLMIVIGEPA